MLPTTHHKSYQKLLNALLSLQEQVILLNPDLSIALATWREIQGIFQTEILSLEDEKLDRAIVSRIQSVKTEMSRAVRLLETDLLFWQTSKQVATSQQRLTSIRDRLKQLIDYCEILLS